MCRAILGIEDGWLYESETAADPIGIGSPTWYKCLEHNPSFAFVLLDLLIKHMLPQMHMVIAARFDPPLPLAKLHSERQLNLSPRPFMGVQRAKPFAGVRGSPTPGVPEKPLFPIFAAAGGQSKKSEQQENPVQEKSAGEKVEGEA